MRAAAFAELSGPNGVEIIDRPWPEAGPQEAVVTVDACSINRHDLWILDGDSVIVSAADLPFVSGLDVVGEVSDVGEGVESVSIGDRVVLCPNQTCGHCRFCRTGPETHCESFSLYHGGFAEAALVDATRLLPLPDGISSIRAAALPTAYLTAAHMLEVASVGPGDTVFIPGVTGGVGVAAVQLAGIRGAMTIGTSSSAEKLEQVQELGMDVSIHADEVDTIRDKIQDVQPPTVAIDHLGGDHTGLAQSVLDRTGTIVVCGRTADPVAPVDVPRLFFHHQRILGSTMGTQSELSDLIDLVDRGLLDPAIDHTFPLEKTDDAFRRMADGKHVGKIIIRP